MELGRCAPTPFPPLPWVSHGRQVAGRGAASRSTKRSTHARPGMHVQQCSAVPLIRWFRKHLSVCTGCTDVCHVTLLSGRVLSAITSSLRVTILGFEVYRRLDRLAVRWLSIGQPVMSSHSTLREEVSGVCVCVRLTLIHLITQTGDNVAVRGPQAQPPLHTIYSVKAFLREKVHNVAFWAMYRSGNAACRCPKDASSSPR